MSVTFIKNRLPLIALLLWYSFFLFHSTDLTQGDLGRHLKNGDIIVTALKSADFSTLSGILHTNFYAYTEPSFPFINHHWGSGVIFFLIFSIGSFPLLSLFFALLSLSTFYFFWSLGKKYGGTWLASLLAVFLIPLIAERVQVRPEVFSYFFMGLYLVLLTRYREGTMKTSYLWLLLPLQILWINLHIYFFFGYILVALFWLEELLTARRRRELIHLGLVTLLLFGVSIINPSGIAGLLFPFRIFDNYPFQIQENQSAFNFSRVFPWYPNVINFKIAFGLMAASAIAALIKKPSVYKQALVLFAGGTCLMALLAVRNWSIFALAALAGWPLLASTFIRIDSARHRTRLIAVGIIILIATLIINRIRLPVSASELGFIATKHSLDAANFVQAHPLSAPLFNDFNVGGYATWAAFPRLRPFVDNRPEAYSQNFFAHTYIPVQHDEAAWKKLDDSYHFNTIWYSFSNSDSLPFILNRLNDPAWAPVFADTFSIIFLKRNATNEALIKQYEMPPSSFRLEPNN